MALKDDFASLAERVASLELKASTTTSAEAPASPDTTELGSIKDRLTKFESSLPSIQDALEALQKTVDAMPKAPVLPAGATVVNATMGDLPDDPDEPTP